MHTRVSSTRFLWRILWLSDTSYSKSVWEGTNRNMPARNTLVQLLAVYTNPESQNAQRHRQTDGLTDGQQDDANSRSYCVAVWSAKNHCTILLHHLWHWFANRTREITSKDRRKVAIILWSAYRNSPTLFRTVSFPTRYAPPFPRLEVCNPRPKLQSLSQERVKLRTSNLASTFRGSIRTKAH